MANELNYITNADLLCIPEYERKVNDCFVIDVQEAVRLNLVASGKGLKSATGGQVMTGKYFEQTMRRGPYASGGSNYRIDGDRFANSVQINKLISKWYLSRINIPWEVDRQTAALMDSREVTKDMIDAMARCNSDMIEAVQVLAGEMIWKGGNGVLATISGSLSSSSGSEYNGWVMTLNTTENSWPAQFLVPGMNICIQDATDVTGAGSLHTSANGLIVVDQLSLTQVFVVLHTSTESGDWTAGNVTTGDFVKRHISQDATAAGACTSATDGYKRKTSSWGIQDLVYDSDPATTINAAAVYVGDTSRSSSPLYKAQVEYGTTRGTEEAFTLKRLQTLERLCRAKGGKPTAFWVGPETAAEIAAQVSSKGRLDQRTMMESEGITVGNIEVAKVKINNRRMDVVMSEKCPTHKGFLLTEPSFLFKMTKKGWHYVGTSSGNVFKHLYPDRDHYAALVCADAELACDNLAGNGVMEDIKHMVE